MSGKAAESSTDSTEGRVARKRAARRRLLERTAAEVFAARGYEGAGFDEIGARLDLRGASLYHYYASKEELFLRTVENGHAEVLARLQPIAAMDAPPEERLRRLFVEQGIIECRDYPAFAPLFLMSVPDPAIAEKVAGLRREHGEIFRRVAYEVAERHGISARRAGVATLLALGALGNLQAWYNPAGPLGLEQVVDEVADILMQSFVAGPMR